MYKSGDRLVHGQNEFINRALAHAISHRTYAREDWRLDKIKQNQVNNLHNIAQFATLDYADTCGIASLPYLDFAEATLAILCGVTTLEGHRRLVASAPS